MKLIKCLGRDSNPGPSEEAKYYPNLKHSLVEVGINTPGQTSKIILLIMDIIGHPKYHPSNLFNTSKLF
jgi:hypothetical protein